MTDLLRRKRAKGSLSLFAAGNVSFKAMNLKHQTSALSSKANVAGQKTHPFDWLRLLRFNAEVAPAVDQMVRTLIHDLACSNISYPINKQLDDI